MKKITVLLFLLFIGKAYSQSADWSAEVNYPWTIGEEGFNEVEGVIDVGLKYRFVDLKVAKLGIGANAGYYKYDFERDGFELKEKDYFIQPKIFADFSIPAVPKLVPSLGMGYSVVIVDFSGDDMGESLDSSENYGGFNINVGFSYDIFANFFVQAQYDLVMLKVKEEIIAYEDNVNLSTLKLGVGFRF